MQPFVMSGQAKSSRKARDCPALGRIIGSAECGAQRVSRIDCPADCAFNPFGTANYDLFAKVDGEWLGKALDRLMAGIGREALQRRVREHTIPVRNPEVQLDFAVHNALYLALFLERDGDGRTLAERWEAEGWGGLNNDERVMMQYRRATLPTVIEVQRVIDELTCECVDLLTPGSPSFLVYDRGVARASVRFGLVLSWLTHYPRFSRTSGIALQIPPALWTAWLDRMSALHRAAGANVPELTFKEFLARSMPAAALEAAQIEADSRQPMRDRMTLRRAHYDLGAPREELEALLDGQADFKRRPPGEDDAEGKPVYDWERPRTGAAPATGASEEPQENAELDTASLTLEGDALVTEALGPENARAIREHVDQVLAGKVTFREETRVDLLEVMQKMRAEEGLVQSAQHDVFGGSRGADQAAGGPAPTQETGDAGERLRRSFETFRDTPLEELSGRTPKEAATDPELRPVLVRIMKAHLHQLAFDNRDRGENHQVDWLLEELGLTELK